MVFSFFRLTVVLSLFVLSSCAKPKYAESGDVDGSQNEGQEVVAGSCDNQFSNSKLCLLWYWEVKPDTQTSGSLIFKTYRLNNFDQTPVETDLSQIPQVILWMPSMGHGSTPTQTTRLDVGTYRTSQVFFVMPGEWDIRFQIKQGSELIDAAQVSLSF